MMSPKGSWMNLMRLVSTFYELRMTTYLDRYKSKNKVLETKIDKLFKLLKQHAFDPDAIPDNYQGKISIEFTEDKNNVEGGDQLNKIGGGKFYSFSIYFCYISNIKTKFLTKSSRKKSVRFRYNETTRSHPCNVSQSRNRRRRSQRKNEGERIRYPNG